MLYINDHIDEIDLEQVAAELSDQRREQMMRYRQELGRRLCAAAYLLLREGLRREYGIEEPPVFEYGEHGKPSIVGHPEIHFNMSHCRAAAVCVLADHPVGVDVEEIKHHDDTLMRYVLNDAELERVKNAEAPDVVFTELWTQKESLAKMRGTGITDDLKTLLNEPHTFETVVNRERGYVYSVIIDN
jgi:4'-phosphopantetheinyl transferase